jgi:hypothetical protein
MAGILRSAARFSIPALAQPQGVKSVIFIVASTKGIFRDPVRAKQLGLALRQQRKTQYDHRCSGGSDGQQPLPKSLDKIGLVAHVCILHSLN